MLAETHEAREGRRQPVPSKGIVALGRRSLWRLRPAEAPYHPSQFLLGDRPLLQLGGDGRTPRRTADCYHPLFVFNQDGDLERCALRAGNVHSAHGWRDVLDPVVARYRGQAVRRLLRGDAAFALPDVYEYLEAEGFHYAIRLPANQVLQSRITELLTRPVGRPPQYIRRFFASFRYRAQSWSRARRVVAKVEWHPGELYPRVGFIVTNLRRPAKKVVTFYNGRGT